MEKIIKSLNNYKLIGIGTGRTCRKFINKMHELLHIKAKNDLIFIPTSFDTENSLNMYGFNVKSLSECKNIDLYIDSADYVDKNKNLIKGFGGALLKERIAMQMSEKIIILVNKSKLVSDFKDKTVPVEITPAVKSFFVAKIQSSIYYSSDICSPIFTENGNLLATVPYKNINSLDIAGILGHGFFDSSIYNLEIVILDEEEIK